MSTAERTAYEILGALAEYRTAHHRAFPGTVLMSTCDVREIDQRQIDNLANQGYGPRVKSAVRLGDTGTIWGVACMAAECPAGTWSLAVTDDQ